MFLFSFGNDHLFPGTPKGHSLDAMEMCIHSCMKKISWIEKKSNGEVLELVGVDRSLLKTIHQRQLRFVGHITRGDSIEKL